jgi:hypothetical protein
VRLLLYCSKLTPRQLRAHTIGILGVPKGSWEDKGHGDSSNTQKEGKKEYQDAPHDDELQSTKLQSATFGHY